MAAHARRQGDLGEASAVEWLAGVGAHVFVPLGHSPDCDLVADLEGRLVRVQVKTSRFRRAGRWEVVMATRGGNRSWSGVVKHFTAERAEYVFVHVADGRRWFIPAGEIGGGTGIRLGGPKYARFEVEPGRPFAIDLATQTLSSAVLGRGSRAVKGARL
jgi:Holliday junction resolvase-like predicted endonuclease